MRWMVLLMMVALIAPALRGQDAKPQAGQKPDVLFILCDDLGWANVGFHGAKYPTPHIDSLTKLGAELTHHYVQPVCSPTRAAFLTGRYPIRYGLQVGVIRPWAEYGLPLEEQTLAQALKTAGYTTAISGKWHLGTIGPEYLPTQRGFDKQYGHLLGAIDYFTHFRDGGHDWRRNDKLIEEEGYSTFLLADEASKIIREQPKDKPLFLYLAFNAPHTPLQAPPEYIEKAKSLGIEGKDQQVYAAMVMAVDVGVGRVLDALKQTQRDKTTLIVFTSDNGGPENHGADNGALRGAKGSVYEGGVRVPTVAVWPGKIKPGTKIDAAVHVVDWYPTLTKLTGAKTNPAGPLDGRDILAVLTQNAPSPHEDILHNITPRHSGIRVGDYKLIVNDVPEDAGKGKKKKKSQVTEDAVLLFNIAQDPGEENNLAAQQPDKVKELRAKLNAYRKAAVEPHVAGNRPPADWKNPKVWGPAN